MQQTHKAGLVAQAVPIPTCTEMNQGGLTLLVGLFQPSESPVFLSGVCIQSRNPNPRDLGSV